MVKKRPSLSAYKQKKPNLECTYSPANFHFTDIVLISSEIYTSEHNYATKLTRY